MHLVIFTSGLKICFIYTQIEKKYSFLFGISNHKTF